jgi:hypothetical protein
MEGYDVISVADDKKLGTVVRDEGDFLVFEHGTLRKQHHAVPQSTVEVDDEAREVRTTLSKSLIEDSPKVEDDSGLDRGALKRHYGLEESEEIQQERERIETAVEERARMRAGEQGDRAGGIPTESPAMLGERYSSADVPEDER